MKINTCLLIFVLYLLSPHASRAQKRYEMILDTLTNGLQTIEVSDANKTARIADHDIQTSVVPNPGRPESAVNIHLNFGASVDIDAVYTVTLIVRPTCTTPCNTNSIATAFLSTKAINKAARTLDYTIGGMISGKTYVLETLIFGLDGPPCGGSSLDQVNFQVGYATGPRSAKMLLVINEEWRNTASVQTKINQYMADLGVSNPNILVEKYYITDDNQSKKTLHQYIKQEYQTHNLTQLFFIGDNAAVFSTRRLLNADGSVAYTNQLYTFINYTLPIYDSFHYLPDFTLMNERYYDPCYRSPGEIREAVFQQLNSLISMGMILPDRNYSFERKTQYVLTYFEKLHKFRQKEISFDKKILMSDGFVDESAAISLAEANGSWTSVSKLPVSHVKDNYYSGYDDAWRNGFVNRLGSESFEIFTLTLHGSPTYHSFGIAPDEINMLPHLNTQLINLASCNVGAFKFPDYLAGIYLEKGNVLNVHCYSDLLLVATSNGESSLEFQFKSNGVFTLMSQGYAVGDAFRLAQSYNENDIILGDPLVRLNDLNPLPVTLEKFDAQKEDNVTKLSWSTSSEINSERFEIEHGTKIGNWSKIGSVMSKQHSNGSRDYYFTHDQPLSGDNFYRLKMVDFNKTFTYSKIRTVHFESGASSIYPNPVSNFLYLPPMLISKTMSVKIYDLRGQRVIETTKIPEKGINIEKLPPGMYVVEIMKVDRTIETERIVVAK